MTHDVNLIDRLRIERVVWTLDQRLYDLPRSSRIAKRREVRQNVLAAAHDVGTPAGAAPTRQRSTACRRLPRRRVRRRAAGSLDDRGSLPAHCHVLSPPVPVRSRQCLRTGRHRWRPECHGHVHLVRPQPDSEPRHVHVQRRCRPVHRGQPVAVRLSRAARLDDPHRTTLAPASDVAHARTSHTKRPSHHRVSRAPAPEQIFRECRSAPVSRHGSVRIGQPRFADVVAGSVGASSGLSRGHRRVRARSEIASLAVRIVSQHGWGRPRDGLDH